MTEEPVAQTKTCSVISSEGLLNISAYRYNDSDDDEWLYEIEIEPWSHYYDGKGYCVSVALTKEQFDLIGGMCDDIRAEVLKHE